MGFRRGEHLPGRFAFVPILACLLALTPPVARRNQPPLSMPQTMKQVEFRLNQIGFGLKWPKCGYVLSGAPPQQAEIVSNDRGTVVLSIPVRPTRQTGLYSLDFSELQQKGQYFLRIGSQYSSQFAVGPGSYRQLEALLLNALELQRCGVQVRDIRGGILHQACHLQDGIVEGRFPPIRVDATGGWHDAGDYGKYVATTAPTIVRLLNIVEWADSSRKGLSETDSLTSDQILPVTRVGIDWMLRMQREDGAVYRKLSGKTWPGEVLPEADSQPRFIFGISTEETGKFAGTMAMVARIFRKTDPQYAARCLLAAKRAWRYLQNHNYSIDRGPDDDGGSGAYPSRVYDDEWTCYTDADDRLWAAIELYLTTHEPGYKEAFWNKLPEKQLTPFEWKDMSTQAFLDLYFLEPALTPAVKEMIFKKVVERAQELVLRSDSNDYGVSLTRFKWGSNKYVAEDGVILLYAYRMTGQESYVRAAVAQLNYLLGTNVVGKCFVTGVGTDPVSKPHHRLMRALRRSFPGFVVGGPTDVSASGVIQAGLGPIGYADDERSYESNEPAIDYNASFLYFLTLLDRIGRG